MGNDETESDFNHGRDRHSRQPNRQPFNKADTECVLQAGKRARLLMLSMCILIEVRSSFTPALEQVKQIYLVAPVGVFDPALCASLLKEAKRLGAKRVVMQSASVVSENGPCLARFTRQCASFQNGRCCALYFMQNFINVQHRMSSNGGAHHNGFG